MNEHVLNHSGPLSAQQPKKVVVIEMFRAGPQISSTGEKLVFTEQDLDQVAGTYNPDHHEAPLIIGHDQDDGTPALGWVRKVWRKGKQLWGKVELTPKAEQLVKDGVFKKVSSSFYLPSAETNPTPGKLSLRHLGLVSIPAVKGLTAFSDYSSDGQTITITAPKTGSSISFKEQLETNQTMARKTQQPKTTALATEPSTKSPATVESSIDHGEGGMTVNINIGGGGSGATAPNVYDDSGSKVSESGAPADYDMDYALDSDTEEGVDPTDPGGDPTPDDGSDPAFPPDDSAPDDSEGIGDDDMNADGLAADNPDPTSGVDSDDVSGEMEGEDEKIAQLASQYEIEDLIKALALKADATSMNEEENMSYGELPEALQKAIDAKKNGNDDSSKEDDEENSKEADMGEEVTEGKKPSGGDEPSGSDANKGEKPSGEEVFGEDEQPDAPSTAELSEDNKEDEDEEKKKAMTSDCGEEPAEATGTLDHSEAAVGVQGQDDLRARVAELEQELAAQKKAVREKEIGDFCESLYGGGRLTEQVVGKSDLVRFMETLNSKNTVNFSENSKKSQFDFFKDVLGKLPAMVSFEEFATPASAVPPKKSPKPTADGYVYDAKNSDIHATALEYSESKGVDYVTALKVILSE